MKLSPEHLRELREAKQLLEEPSIAARLTDAIGSPIEKGLKMLPGGWSSTIDTAVQKSLTKALEVSVKSLARRRSLRAREKLHRTAVFATGAAGGAFGLGGLVVELPVSTTLMLRSIADIARSQGEDINEVRSQLACLEVFALGGKTQKDDAAETGYFAIRSALASSVTEAARYLAQKGLVDKTAPALVRFISVIAGRFGVVVSEKVAAMAIPALGAAGGALVNSIFMRHFQNMARGHFTVRRLEREYGPELIRAEYEAILLD
jgi:hypothetical protein